VSVHPENGCDVFDAVSLEDSYATFLDAGRQR
jgi:hypothetical protein